MSNISFMDKLLDGVEVEWVPLQKIAKIKHGKDWKGLSSGNIPIYGSGGIMGYVDTYSYNKPTVLIPRKGSITNVFYIETPFWNVDTIYYSEIDDSKIIPKFFYYVIKTIDLLALDTGSGRPSLTQAILNQIQIPIPCPNNPEKSLEIQAEIVNGLDTFTALTTELTTELNTRKKQYNYYRDQLLSFEEEAVEWKMLGEVAEYSKGRISSQELNENNYVGVESLLQNRAGKVNSIRVPDSGNHTQYIEGDILIGNIRPYLKKIWHADDAGGTNGDVLVVHSTDAEPRYLYQVLADDKFFEYNMQHSKGAKMPRGNKVKIMEYLIPIPYPNNPEKSLAEQKRIVAILDKFDTLTHSITEGLPREIELRKKQYEHYRDLLLSFPKSGVELRAEV